MRGIARKLRPCVALALLRRYGLAKIQYNEGLHSILCVCCAFACFRIEVTIDSQSSPICERCFAKSNQALFDIYAKTALVVSVLQIIHDHIPDIIDNLAYFVINVGIV